MYTNMWVQADLVMAAIRRKVLEKSELYQKGYALICHSQGALLCRAVVELMDDHNVHTLISLSGPQLGVFGIPVGRIQHFYPETRDLVFEFAYTPPFQDFLAEANFWHDPRPGEWPLYSPRARYLAGNNFLPVVNNDPDWGTQGPGRPKAIIEEGERYKANFLRLQRAVFTSSPADEQIIPADSAIWGFYGDSVKDGTVPLQKQKIWVDDWLGLRVLHETGRLQLISAPGVRHMDWVNNKVVFDKFIAPYLPRAATEIADAGSSTLWNWTWH